MENLISVIESNQNATGGGLAVNVTGKYESNRHALAKLDADKLTAGEAAKKVSKILGVKILAKELVSYFKLAKGYDPEWHHAGFIPKKGMAKTYFFKASELDSLVEICKNKEALIAETERKVFGFYYEWTKSGGKNCKVLKTFEGQLNHTPRFFTECTKVQFELFKKIEGKLYFGWSEPSTMDVIDEERKANGTYYHGDGSERHAGGKCMF